MARRTPPPTPEEIAIQEEQERLERERQQREINKLHFRFIQNPRLIAEMIYELQREKAEAKHFHSPLDGIYG